MAVTETVRHERTERATVVDATGETALWYKDAVVYQLHVKSFFDAGGDGVGDFKGLARKLDYVQSLGATAIWLLPFYPSPLKDDGYDIADYTRVNPAYGTLRDFKKLLKEAHSRDLRVITELVLNHTSDQHAWFQRSRRAKRGTKWRDFYVWSDTAKEYADTRIIFQDFEASNWTWDPIAEAYYWHRFYSHQPDLNFDNPEVHQALFEVLDFWLEMGVDGMRLDAVPYLYEREGTTCENLPETHAFLKNLRAHVDSRFDDRMMLAEANQWPEDAAAYYGDGDECHMNFHFPLMPRLFMAVQREDRFPVVDILQQTPEIPDNCQWAIFLRNHDELTLEMVTDEDRDYMYRAYAEDPHARINLGIRRRLAPLLKNDRRKIELLNALLLSMPGTPIVYYGDEIGMGDNHYLGDRSGVRTPMQWTADRNAGFSTANPQQLFLPVIIDSAFHYTTKNVEVEEHSPHSLLWWMRRLISLRKRHPAFSRGTFEVVESENVKVLAYLRRYGDETILVVASLSRFVQAVTFDLSEFVGAVPTELSGHTKLPAVEESPYTLTLAPHAFYWLKLETPEPEATAVSPENLPAVAVREGWQDVFRGRPRQRLQNLLPAYLQRHRWFGGKARTIQSLEIDEAIPLEGGSGPSIRAVLVTITYTAGEPETYLLPLSSVSGLDADHMLEEHPEKAILWAKRGEERELVYEAVLEEAFWSSLLNTIAKRKTLKGERADVAGKQTRAYRKIAGRNGIPSGLSVHGGEQSNTSAIVGDRFIFKLFRRINPGVNPDLEIGRFLTEKSHLEHVPRVAGALEYEDGGEPRTLAILQEFQPNEGDAWEYTLHAIGRFVEECLSLGPESVPSGADLAEGVSFLALSQRELPDLAHRTVGEYVHSAMLLGQRTAELHLALASDNEDPAFAPEAFTPFYQRGLYESMRTQAKQAFQLLRKRVSSLPDALQEQARAVAGVEPDVVNSLKRLTQGKITGLRTRCHGDYHLGQVLYTGRDFVIIDFEGEPERPLGERRIKTSPLRDVAGMLRSFDYAAHAVLQGQAQGIIFPDDSYPRVATWLRFWFTWTAAKFLRSYLETAEAGRFLPASDEQRGILLEAYVLQKLLYELKYELNNRPGWAGIPLTAIRDLSRPAS